MEYPLPKFDFSASFLDPVEISKMVAKKMIAEKKLSQSAPDMNLPYRMFCLNANPVLAIFNPFIIDCSEETVYFNEGPYDVKIKRPAVIRVRYTEPNGNVVTTVFEGLSARLFLHEFDSLEGIDYMSRASRYHREQAMKRAKKHDNGE